MKFREHHLSILLEKWRKETTPCDLLLRHYFRQNKALGSKDRAWIGETFYHYIRWKNVYDTHKLHPTEPLPDLSMAEINLRLGAPQKLIDMLVHAYGIEKTEEICAVSQTRAPVTIRVNTLKISRDELIQKLSPHYELAPTPHSMIGITFSTKVNFSALLEFKEGLFEVQDEASQLAAELVQPDLKQQILDYCAGSGGKSLAIALKMQRSGQLYLHDIRPAALLEAKKRCGRAGIQNVQFNLPHKKLSMDWVIVDAPCSGTGTLRRNPDLKWKFHTLDLQKLLQEQKNIFEEALAYLKPTGHIVYMTCSILPQENEQQVEYFKEKYNLKVTQTFQTLPILNGMDGFFGAVLSHK